MAAIPLLTDGALARPCDEPWPTYRGDNQRTGACGDVPGPGTGKILWSIVTKGLNSPGSPAVVGDTVYFAADQYVYAVDRDDGSVRWTYETDGGIGSSPAIVNGTLYIGSGDGYVYALDATDGTLEWRYPTETGVNSPPSVKDGRVVVGLRSNAVLALDAATGAELWNTSTEKRVTTSPLLWQDRVFIGERGETFYALDARNGEILWTRDLGWRGVRHSPAMHAGMLYVSTGAGDLYTLRPTTGDLIRHQEETVDFGGSVAIADGTRMYVSGDDGQLLSLDIDTRRISWNTSRDGALRPVAVGLGTVYVSDSSGTVSALNTTTGGTVWETQTAPVSRSPPTLADGVLYIGSDNFEFFALDAGISDEEPGRVGPGDRPDPDGSGEQGSNQSPGVGLALALALPGLAGLLRRRRC